MVDHGGRCYSGWTVNPIKEIIRSEDRPFGVKHVYQYKFPLIVTDFTEYLKLYRNNLVIRYDQNFRNLDVLSYEELNSSKYI